MSLNFCEATPLCISRGVVALVNSMSLDEFGIQLISRSLKHLSPNQIFLLAHEALRIGSMEDIVHEIISNPAFDNFTKDVDGVENLKLAFERADLS